jgi:hypothetical protein
VGRSRLQCNDITPEAPRRVTRSRCGVATRAMRRLPESKSDSLERFGRSGVTLYTSRGLNRFHRQKNGPSGDVGCSTYSGSVSLVGGR